MRKYLTILSFLCCSAFGQLGFYASTIVPLDKDAVKYIKAISTINVPSNAQKQAANYLAIKFKTMNWTTANLFVFGCEACSGQKAVYLFFGNDSVCDKLNFLNPVNADSAYRLSQVGLILDHLVAHSNDVNPSILCGISCVHAYYNPHFAMSSGFRNDFSVTCYMTDPSTSANYASWGTEDHDIILLPSFAGANCIYGVNSTPFGSVHANTNPGGLWLANRRVSTFITMYHNSATFDSTASASVATTNNLQLGYV